MFHKNGSKVFPKVWHSLKNENLACGYSYAYPIFIGRLGDIRDFRTQTLSQDRLSTLWTSVAWRVTWIYIPCQVVMEQLIENGRCWKKWRSIYLLLMLPSPSTDFIYCFFRYSHPAATGLSLTSLVERVYKSRNVNTLFLLPKAKQKKRRKISLVRLYHFSCKTKEVFNFYWHEIRSKKIPQTIFFNCLEFG